ncbi:MAG: hypothetical protein K0B05_01600 [Bacteroidales bacterium]|nr:hypothetical protein [Bacteroidales bacterium]
MLPEKRSYAINWIDGMKLNKDQFTGLDNWILDSIRDSISIQLNDFNYGLLECSGDSDSSLKLMVNIDQNNQINIKLTDCRALTKGGVRIEITSRDIQNFQYPVDKLAFDFNVAEASNEMFDIILAVFPEKRVPVGVPAENEVPFRHPFVMSEYQLHAVPTKQVNSSQMWKNHITVGRFHVIAHEVQFNTEYIPPCTRVDAYPSLVEYYHKYGNTVERITNALAEYLRKNRLSQNKLEINLVYIIEKLVYYLTINLSNYKLLLKSLPPVYFIEFFINFARLFKSALSWLSEYDREEVLNYLSRWISSRDLDNSAFELMNLEYDHQDIYVSVSKVENYLTLVNDLFEKMVFAGKAEQPVKESKPQPRHGPVIIKDGKRIN